MSAASCAPDARVALSFSLAGISESGLSRGEMAGGVGAVARRTSGAGLRGMCEAEMPSVRRGSGPSDQRPLLPRPLRLALAEEGRDPLARVFGAERGREALLLGLDPLIPVGPGGDLLHLLHRHRRLAGQLASPGNRGIEQLVVRDDFVGDAEVV